MAPRSKNHYSSLIKALDELHVRDPPLADNGINNLFLEKHRCGGYKPDYSIPFKTDFNRLAAAKRWTRRSPAYHNAMCDAWEAEFQRFYIGHDTLRNLQILCEDVGISPRRSITGCKKELNKLHINLDNFVNYKRGLTGLIKFRNHRELCEYTYDGHCVPLDVARNSLVSKMLMKDFS